MNTLSGCDDSNRTYFGLFGTPGFRCKSESLIGLVARPRPLAGPLLSQVRGEDSLRTFSKLYEVQNSCYDCCYCSFLLVLLPLWSSLLPSGPSLLFGAMVHIIGNHHIYTHTFPEARAWERERVPCCTLHISSRLAVLIRGYLHQATWSPGHSPA